jgi:N-acetylneuraminate synthase
LCSSVKTAWNSLGSVDYGLKSSEEGSIKFRRSLYFVRDIRKGEVITKDHVKSIRPGYGLAPKLIDQVIKKVAKIDITAGTAVSNLLIE